MRKKLGYMELQPGRSTTPCNPQYPHVVNHSHPTICVISLVVQLNQDLKTQLVSRSKPKGPLIYTPNTTQDQKQICS